jgi:excisionase family DNA binding protein
MAELMTLEEVAEYLRVTRKTIYRLLEKRAIPSARVGHQWRFDKTSIEAWLRSNSSGNTANVLVIDDDGSVCDMFRDILEEAGHTVKTTTDSREGLRLAVAGSFDIVFLDLKMPVIDGAALFREIRVVKPDIPVTIVTAYPDSELMLNALASGPFSVMKKPFTGSDILTVIRTYLHFGMPVRSR